LDATTEFLGEGERKFPFLIQRFNDSTIQRFNDSTIQRFNDSTIQRFEKEEMSYYHEISEIG